MARPKDRNRVVIMREATEEIEHVVSLARRIDAFREIIGDPDSCHCFFAGSRDPVHVLGSASEHAMSAFGHVKKYRTRDLHHPQYYYINDDAISHIKFESRGREPMRAKKGERGITVFMDSGNKFRVVEKPDIAIRSLFNSSNVKFEFPHSKKLERKPNE